MTTEIERVVDQLRRQLEGDPWHGPSLKEILEGITPEQAMRRVAPGAHSIWELVLHMTGWAREVAARMRGQAAAEPEEGDWPAPPGQPDEAQWRAAKTDLARAHRELFDGIEALPPRRLHQPVKDFRNSALGTGMTAYQTIYGLIQHDVYHSGQIALLKKIVQAGE